MPGFDVWDWVIIAALVALIGILVVVGRDRGAKR